MTIESFESSQISNQFTLILYEVLVVKAHAQRDHQLDGLLVILTTERFHASEGTLGHDSSLMVALNLCHQGWLLVHSSRT